MSDASTQDEQYEEWKSFPLSKQMEVDIAMASYYSKEVLALEITVLAAIEALHKLEYDAVENYLHQAMKLLNVRY